MLCFAYMLTNFVHTLIYIFLNNEDAYKILYVFLYEFFDDVDEKKRRIFWCSLDVDNGEKK